MTEEGASFLEREREREREREISRRADADADAHRVSFVDFIYFSDHGEGMEALLFRKYTFLVPSTTLHGQGMGALPF